MHNILNIVNFLRGVEPRNPAIDLAEPAREQIRLMRENRLPGTFLLQYDAMLRKDIMDMMLALDPKQFERGVWLEMNRPHVEAAGLPWRGRPGFDWDWHANVGFSVGYLPEERERLIDVLFEKFRALFGAYPKSCGSWMLDAHSLRYMREKYGVVAACICKDQWGTDGYTIWGGYWNQAYYPSRHNALCPAQTKAAQIDLPVFRMLGSDPVTQYDLGLKIDDGASECQSVASLEPVYKWGGGDPEWIEWFARQNYAGGSLAFAYAQAGQENSFGWPAMKKGLEYQFPFFARMRDEGRLNVERLCDSGEWYLSNFPATPATSVAALEPYHDSGAQSVWYDCRNYRANLYSDEHGLRLRDVYLFAEDIEERYIRARCETEYLVYDNLPVIDGNRESGGGVRAGGWLEDKNGAPMQGEIRVREDGSALLCTFAGGGVTFSEDGITVSGGARILLRADARRSHITGVDGSHVRYRHNGRDYVLTVSGGRVEKRGDGVALIPDGDAMRVLPA